MFNNKKDTSKTSKKIDLIFDIRNSSAGLGVVEITKNERVIIYTNRRYSNPSVVRDVKTFEKQIEKITDDLIEDFIIFKKKNNIRQILNVNCVFSAPWYEADINNLTFKENKKTKLTEKYLDQKIEKGDINDELESVENNLLSVSLNGYETENPFGKTFTSIELSFYKSFIDKENKIKQKIEDKINTNKLNVHTHPFVILSVLRANFHNVNNFSLFDIGGEMTEISIFKNSILKELITLPTGFNSIIRNISKTTNDEQITISKIKMLNLNQINDDELLEKINSNIEAWLETTKKILNSNEIQLPNDFFIAIDKDYKKLIKDILSKKDFYSMILNKNRQPNIRILDSIDQKNLAVYAKNVNRDPLISIIYNFSTIEI